MDTYEYTKQFKRLIEKERSAEIDFHTAEIKRLNGFKREAKGRALINMVCQRNPKLEADSIFRFVKKSGDKFPHNEFSTGTNVLISKNEYNANPLDNYLNGVIKSKSAIYMDVYVDNQSSMIYHKDLRIDLFVNDTTFKAQKEILDGMKGWSFERGDMREIILHNKKPKLGSPEKADYYDLNLNPSQKLAVDYSLREKDFYLIQGPPGTGKTKTSIEIIRQHLKRKKTILVAADSNMAVDNIMLGLLKSVEVIRIGDSPKIMDEIQEHTLTEMIKKNFKYSIVARGMEQISKFREEQRNCIIPNRKNSKGISYFQIKKMAEHNQAGFGLNRDKIQSMSKWIKAQERIKEIRFKVDKLKEQIIKDCIKGASVICTTNTNANSRFLDGIVFDLVLIDEAGQSTEPSCLIPISKAKKIILVGDHKQLPPTILSPEAQDLSVSLFERMMTNSRYTLLDTQYRMHPLINEFPSGEFYNGELKAASNTLTHELDDPIFHKNLIFIESLGKEMIHKGATSFCNNDEVELVFNLVLEYKKKGMEIGDLGIISPYNEQVKKLKDRLPFVEVNSIDGFQGREKKIIIMSLVRSNDKGNIGFLKDLRRFNVALTRAQEELVVIGNPNTVRSNETYGRFLDFVKEKGLYVKADEIKKFIEN